jgi:hypothetical protein
MTADRSELHELIDELPDDQVALVADDLRRRLPRPRADRPWPPEWFGMITDGPSDASSPERIDQVLSQGFGRR